MLTGVLYVTQRENDIEQNKAKRNKKKERENDIEQNIINRNKKK